MTYSKTPTTIIKPSSEVRRIIDELRTNKRTQVERLRKMKPEEFSKCIIL